MRFCDFNTVEVSGGYHHSCQNCGRELQTKSKSATAECYVFEGTDQLLDSYEPRRRETICRSCDQWDAQVDGCGLLRQCERHSLIRALWYRQESGCQLNRWAPSFNDNELLPPTVPRDLCPTCDLPVPIIRSLNDVHATVREILTRDLQPPAFNAPMGIVTSGEGKYELGIVVMVKLLRDVIKCDLPVKIFHNGPWNTCLQGYDVELVNTQIMQATHPAKRYGGWESKSYAVMHSGFERVLFLDADAYLVADPKPLFALLEQHSYCGWGTWGPGNLCGEIPDTLNQPHFNGGHYLVDLAHFWGPINAIRFLDNHSQIFYRVNRIGDECSTRLVRALIADAGVHCVEYFRWTANVGCLCGLPGGPAIIAHRASNRPRRGASKLFVGTIPNSNSNWPLEAEVLQLFKKEHSDPKKLEMEAKYAKTQEGRRDARKKLVQEVREMKNKKRKCSMRTG